MAQQVWFLRHGEAEPHEARPDPERRLTELGEEQSRIAGRALERLRIPIHVVFSSPKVRAWETARLACESLRVEPIEHKPLGDGFTREDLLELAAGDPDNRILVVGHNPTFEQVIYDLTGARTDLRKGAVAGVRLRGGEGELIALLQPRELALVAGH
jgi:phosphohistidine phosphatase